MSHTSERPSVHAIHAVLESTGGPTYVKTPSPGAVAAVFDVVAGMDDPPGVRILAPRWVADAEVRAALSGTGREPLAGEGVELRASHATVTDTTLVTPDDVVQFGEGGRESCVGAAFAESVYEAHGREWERADPVEGSAPERASG